MTEDDPVCPACGEVSENTYNCSECGKPDIDTGEKSRDHGRSVLGGSQ